MNDNEVCVGATPGETFTYDAPPMGHVDATLAVKLSLDAYYRALVELARVRWAIQFDALDKEQDVGKLDAFKKVIDDAVAKMTIGVGK